MKRVVILGAGFAGLGAVRELRLAPVEVTWVDRNNYHAFLPLLYQVAAAELEPDAIAYPARTILRAWRNTRFLLAEVSELDLAGKTVGDGQHRLAYDFLVIALGSAHNFFSIPGAVEKAYPLKTMREGVLLRNQILRCFERASTETDAEARRRLLTFTIVGGGPTGVEFAGALAELVRGPLERDFPELNLREVRLLLIESEPVLLPHTPTRLRDYTQHRLARMGIEVLVDSKVSEVTADFVLLKGGKRISTATVIWTAGVQGAPQAKQWGLPLGRGGRVVVEPTLQLPGHPEVYVAGDLAYVEHEGKPLTQIAPVALQEGTTAARNICRQLSGQRAEAFRYRDRGTMVVIGRNAAIAQLRGGHNCTGWPAWLLWLGVHLFNLIGFRNRLVVMINWAWDYFFFERGVRLMLPGSARQLR